MWWSAVQFLGNVRSGSNAHSLPFTRFRRSEIRTPSQCQCSRTGSKAWGLANNASTGTLVTSKGPIWVCKLTRLRMPARSVC